MSSWGITYKTSFLSANAKFRHEAESELSVQTWKQILRGNYFIFSFIGNVITKKIFICRLPCSSDCKEICLQCRRPGFCPVVRKISWRREWQHTPVFFLGEFPWTEEPGRLHSMGSQRVGHDWVTQHSTAHNSFRDSFKL